MLRLELFFEPDHPPVLPPDLVCDCHTPVPWGIFLEWDQVEQTLNRLDLNQINDFRLYSATLEDLISALCNPIVSPCRSCCNFRSAVYGVEELAVVMAGDSLNGNHQSSIEHDCVRQFCHQK